MTRTAISPRLAIKTLLSTYGSLAGVIIEERTLQSLAGVTRFSDIRQFERIDSTNRYLLDEARGGAAEGIVAVAAYQSQGRGRRGRTWTAPPDASLLVSVLLRPIGLPADRRHLVTAALSLAAVAACEKVAGFRPGVKWPNDLVVEDRKLAGILAEVEGDAIVAGLGMNLNWPSDQLPEGAVAVNGVRGGPVDRGQMLVALLLHLEHRCAQLSEPAGWMALLEAARASSATIGREVAVDMVDRTVVGRAEAIDGSGHLRVRTADGTSLEVTAGDVIHLRPTFPA
jgi:BirA family transcriptional regulator, biotin operon repressor / biotin---[acetyl-CoA-carboxylase] ligase